MNCAIFQFNPIVGALDSNTTRLMAAIDAAISNGCDIFISPELSLCGYIPEDLLFRQDFHSQLSASLNKFLSFRDITILIGAPYLTDSGCYNSVFVIRDGVIIARHDKQKLPNYEVFDECRYFIPGDKPTVFLHNERKIGLIICEDTWHKEPAIMAAKEGAEVLLTINASPFSIGKNEERIAVAKERVADTHIPLIYINQLGGQDSLVFDGASFILDKTGELIAQFPAFETELNYFTLSANSVPSITPYPKPVESAYNALVLATRDYVSKNGFNGVLLGLSGGIDSALTLAIAVDALGRDKVLAVMLPSIYTADISLIDARDMVARLGVHYQEIEINPVFAQLKEQLSPAFTLLESSLSYSKTIKDATDENLQARSRGVLLMALSNKFGYLLLTTGNKSELATGYATLYGDMAGGFAVLKDVPKTLVYQLSNWRNTKSDVIPKRIITRAPSAELRENQKDSDSLPDYAILDKIIELIIGEKLSSREVIERGFNESDVLKVSRLIKSNEYKRSQGAVGPKITKYSFTRDWRYPLTNHFYF